MSDVIPRVEKIKQGHPLDTDTMIGAQASNDQLEKILSYVDIGRRAEPAGVVLGQRSGFLLIDMAREPRTP